MLKTNSRSPNVIGELKTHSFVRAEAEQQYCYEIDLTALILGLDPEQLSTFLSRPRTIFDVAKHLGVPVTQAESLLIKAVESGSVLVTSPPSTGSLKVHAENERGAKRIGFLPTTIVREKGRNLPQIEASRMISKLILNDKRRVHFKLCEPRPSSIQKPRVLPTTSQIMGGRTKQHHNKGHVSLPQLALLFETLQGGPKSMVELRANVGVTRGTLERLVRRGILSTVSSRRGVGLSFKLTKKGGEERARLKTVRTLDDKLARLPHISAKKSISISF